MSHSRCILAVDFGTVRVGLAVSDPDRKFAFPLATYERRSREQDSSYFKAVMGEQNVGQIVVGLPVHLSGQEGAKAREARRFGDWLAQLSGLPVIFWDERFTTVQAEQLLLDAGMTNQRRKSRRDKLAAQILLQSYLEAGCPTDLRPGPLEEAPTPEP